MISTHEDKNKHKKNSLLVLLSMECEGEERLSSVSQHGGVKSKPLKKNVD